MLLTVNTLAPMTLTHAQNGYVAIVNPSNDVAWAQQGRKPAEKSVI